MSHQPLLNTSRCTSSIKQRAIGMTKRVEAKVEISNLSPVGRSTFCCKLPCSYGLPVRGLGNNHPSTDGAACFFNSNNSAAKSNQAATHLPNIQSSRDLRHRAQPLGRYSASDCRKSKSCHLSARSTSGFLPRLVLPLISTGSIGLRCAGTTSQSILFLKSRRSKAMCAFVTGLHGNDLNQPCTSAGVTLLIRVFLHSGRRRVSMICR